ncbi:MAG: DUF4331 domain-containing protein [Nitrospirota bacterium]|nr:DUF4331 domain-containing protein [Nitrospirota bacterium]
MSYLQAHKHSLFAFGLGALAATGVAIHQTGKSLPAVHASDHVDSPTIAQYVAADIGDNWAFLDPNDNSKVVLILDTKGFLVSSEAFGQVIFDSNLRYRFEIENTGDATPDAFIDVRYSPGVGRLTGQTATITLPNGATFTAPTTVADQAYTPNPPIVTTDPATGVKFFAGSMADPFFLDDTGANRFVASSLMNPGNPDRALLSERGGRNTYAGFNQLITAVEVPVAMLRGPSTSIIGTNAVTQLRRNLIVRTDGSIVSSGEWITIDRDGNPLVNNGLIPAPRKNQYNAATTQEDANGKFRDSIIESLNNFGTNGEYQAKILKAVQVNGDILRLDTKVRNYGAQGGDNPGGGFGHMGGRRLLDDVVDDTFTLINNGVHLGDLVNAPSKRLRDQFPFVADPYQPFHKGTISDGTMQ